MEIPEYFRRKASRQFGEAGPPWVERLPSILAWCEDTWRLRSCLPVDELSINLVCFAESELLGKVVLKVQGPHGQRYTEMEALEAYDGQHACALLRSDRPRAAMLLERLLPGDRLRSLSDPDEQLAIGTEIMAALPVSPPGALGLPAYQDWISAAFSRLHRDYDPDAAMRALMVSAQELYTEISAGAEAPVLLHGDLHHDNILRSGDGHWKVIDPQGVIGASFLECGRFLENHVIPDDREPDPGEVARAVTFVASRLRESPRRIASSLFILHLLATCWGFEMSYEQEQLRLQSRQCELLLELVRRI